MRLSYLFLLLCVLSMGLTSPWTLHAAAKTPNKTSETPPPITPPLKTNPNVKTYNTFDNALQAIFDDKATNDTALVATEVTTNMSKKHIQDIEAAIGLGIQLNTFNLYTVTKQQTHVGWSIVIDELGKFFPITLMIGITPQHKIKGIKVMVYREKIGRAIRKNRFLNQFRGKTLNNPIALHQDIDGISGATISSWAVASAAKKALALSQALNKPTDNTTIPPTKNP